MESGRYALVNELAEAEKINQSYLCQVPRLTPLALDIVDSISDGRQPSRHQRDALMKPFPTE